MHRHPSLRTIGWTLVLGLALPALAAADAPVVSTVTPDPELTRSILGNDQPEPSRGLLSSGLIDPSRFSLRHSVSYGVYSGSYGTESGGLWLTEVGYRLADPLHLSVDVGMALNPATGELFNTDNVYLHGFNLDYTPSDKFHMQLSYRNAPPAGSRVPWHAWGHDCPSQPWRAGVDRP